MNKIRNFRQNHFGHSELEFGYLFGIWDLGFGI